MERNRNMLKNEKIKVAIAGYGNLGRGAELAIAGCPDMVLTNIFTRRTPAAIVPITEGVEVLGSEVLDAACERFASGGAEGRQGCVGDDACYRDAAFELPDVLLICGGSAQDLPWQSPKYAKICNIVDSFDNHAKIYEHFSKVDEAAKEGGRLAVIAAGWDPGLFSLCRGMGEALLPCGRTASFWGKGISQGHSDALRRIDGVLDARQYTVPKKEILEAFRRGDTQICDRAAEEQGKLFDEGCGSACGKEAGMSWSDEHCSDFASGKGRHSRECFVVAEPGVDREKIREEIIHMPDYFEGYDTTVNFIEPELLRAEHSKLPHAGTVIRVGRTGRAAPCPPAASPSAERMGEAAAVSAASRECTASGSAPHASADRTASCRAILEFSLTLDSNPEFTAQVMVAYARAAYRLAQAGETGARSVFDIPPAALLPLSYEEIISRFL